MVCFPVQKNPEESAYTEDITDIFNQDKAVRGMERLLKEVMDLEYKEGKLINYKKWKKNFNMDTLVQDISTAD